MVAGYFFAPRLDALGLRRPSAAPLLALREAPRVAGKLAAVLVGAALCFLVGLLDDVMGARLPVAVKLAGQALAAGVIAFGGVRTTVMPEEWMNVVLTLVWLVGITNAFNLLDNMDGLTAGVAFAASLVFLLNAWLAGRALHRAAPGRVHGRPARLPRLQLAPGARVPGRLRQPLRRLRDGVADPARALRLARVLDALPGA